VNEKDFIINFPLLSTRKHKIGFGKQTVSDFLVCSGVLDDITGLHTHCFDGKVDNLHKINFVSKREVKQLKLVNFCKLRDLTVQCSARL